MLPLPFRESEAILLSGVTPRPSGCPFTVSKSQKIRGRCIKHHSTPRSPEPHGHARLSDDYMEARTGMSSSGSWPGGRERAADIIDLDRYMRGNVRPHGRHRDARYVNSSDRLVVDAGGPTSVPGGPVGLPLGGPTGGSVASPRTRASPSPRPKSCSTSSILMRDKRYSHDSGLSDGSYNVRRRTHRRILADNPTTRAFRDRGRGRERDRERAPRSSHSLRNFRLTCERALREQQEQIARMTQICERLALKNERASRAAPRKAPRQPSLSQDSSDISSSSISSTKDKLRKDKHRTNECKTYKIIMNKLDDLNRMFATRNRAVPPRRRAFAPTRITSAGSVSVCDKLVNTEPPEKHFNRPLKSLTSYATCADARPVFVTPRTPLSVTHSISQKRPPSLVERGVGTRRTSRAAITRLATTQAHELDIAPSEATPRVMRKRTPRSGRCNVVTESVIEEYDSEDADGSRAQSPHCKFDLDNPLHFYQQSKRLSPRKKQVRTQSDHESSRVHCNKSRDHTHYVSLCGRCRGYWRNLTALASQLFYGPVKQPNVS
ncbi:hypothetical protein NE865_04241 [Phthorimaea operculella]|nr:hypothetical protein NE865_04241 [Phthorimaea operculella]